MIVSLYDSKDAMQQHTAQPARIILQDRTVFSGFSFGWNASCYGEVVFQTGMTGYVEALTDPSYAGQILILTYPLIGNYGVPSSVFFESEKIQVEGVVVSEYCEQFSHAEAKKSFSYWLNENKVPAICGVDTRELTKKLREQGTMLGKIIVNKNLKGFMDPNKTNLVAQVSCKKPVLYSGSEKKIILIDCGAKQTIIRALLNRKVMIKRVPWDYDFLKKKCDGIILSNGPGDPAQCEATIRHLKMSMQKNIPIFGICLGAQILALAGGGKTYKLKYGHRSQNQPVEEIGTKRCFVTSQNHGYAIDEAGLPEDWNVWFKNLNDGTLEGIIHKTKPYFAVQFHPEASPGPTDTEWIIDKFLNLCDSKTLKKS